MAKTFKSNALREHGKYDDDMKDWLDGLTQISFKEVRQLTLRPVTPFLMMARHWPVSLTSGKNTPPMWCPKFNSETQKFDAEYPCHLHDDFGDRWKAQKTIIFGAIVREWQEEGKRNPVGLIVLPGSASTTLVQIVGINKYDISDPAKGCDLSVVYAKEAAAAQRWQIQRTDRTPLTDDEKGYKVPDLDKLSPDFGDPKFLAEYTKATKKKLSNFAYYVSPKGNDEEGWSGYQKDSNGRPYTDFPDLLALVGDGKDNGDKKVEAKKKPRDEDSSLRLKRHHDVVEDDEDQPPPKKSKAPPPDDDEDDEAPPAKKSKAPPPEDDDEDQPPPSKKTKAPPDDDDEDDGEDEDEEEAPPAKKTKPLPVSRADMDDDEAPPVKSKKSKDDDAEPPFEPDEKPAKKLKVIQPTEGAEDWSEEYSITWKKSDDGEAVPKCFGVFAGAKKCKNGCPVLRECKAADAED